MNIWNKNEKLWRDQTAFEIYLQSTSRLTNSVSKKELIASEFLEIANDLDDMMQAYEKKFGPIDDPLFFFTFAQCNALFLQVGKQYDSLGSLRVGYIINGFKECLTKHLLYPSFNEMILNSIFDTYVQFANENDMNWFKQNKPKFLPFSSLQ